MGLLSQRRGFEIVSFNDIAFLLPEDDFNLSFMIVKVSRGNK